MSSVEIKSPKEVESLRRACRMAAETLLSAAELIRPGITTDEINRFVHEDTLRRGARPAPLNYRGFPKSVCTSINEVVCHGIPGAERLKDGDIINVDVTSIYDGFHGDTSATFYVGTPTKEARHVTEIARRSLELGIAEVRDGARLGDIGAAIQEYAEGEGCSVVRDFVGHGIGRRFHEPPQVTHYGTRGNPGERLEAGMIFTIEPMINIGRLRGRRPRRRVDRRDPRRLALRAVRAHAGRHEDGCEVLTARDRPLRSSEIFPSAFGLEARG